ncbi:MAG: hypothetical protein PHQ23_04885, partial [Candidatus Wallbacteria bacterium]|nr:hypothetical protein [Candidatus Wallbacteria bacterium]
VYDGEIARNKVTGLLYQAVDVQVQEKQPDVISLRCFWPDKKENLLILTTIMSLAFEKNRELLGSGTDQGFTLLEPPYLNPMPVKPDIRTVAILFTSAGIVIALCLVFLLYFIQDRLSVYSVAGLFERVIRTDDKELGVLIRDWCAANRDAGIVIFLMPRREFDPALLRGAVESNGFKACDKTTDFENSADEKRALIVPQAMDAECKSWLPLIPSADRIVVLLSEKTSKFKNAQRISQLTAGRSAVTAVVCR